MCTMATKLTMLLFVALISINLTAGEMPVDCCPKVTDPKFRRRCPQVQSYILKDASTGCRLDATVFITKNAKLCMPYPSQSRRVRACIAAVDARGARK